MIKCSLNFLSSAYGVFSRNWIFPCCCSTQFALSPVSFIIKCGIHISVHWHRLGLVDILFFIPSYHLNLRDKKLCMVYALETQLE